MYLMTKLLNKSIRKNWIIETNPMTPADVENEVKNGH